MYDDEPQTPGQGVASFGRDEAPTAGRPTRSILVVSPDFATPPTWGFVKRVHHLTRHLARYQDVSLVTLTHAVEGGRDIPPDIGLTEYVAIAREGSRRWHKRVKQGTSMVSRTPFHVAKVRDARLQRAVDEIAARKRFDLIQLETSQLGWLRLPPGIPVVFDEHNVESELLERMGATESSMLRRTFNRWEHRRYFAFETTAWSRASGFATTSQRDADAVRERCPDVPVRVVPNGVDTDVFKSSGPPPSGGSITFVALLDYRPNQEGISWFLREILPRIRAARRDAKVTIVGRGPDAVLDSLRQPGVTVTGWVPEVVPYLEEASVVIVPLRIGGGTRLKVVEAMSMGRPIVSTSLGSEGIEAVHGEHLLLADDASSFAGYVTQLLNDPALGDRLGDNARRLAVEKYSWAHAATALQDLHDSVRSRCTSADGSVQARRDNS